MAASSLDPAFRVAAPVLDAPAGPGPAVLQRPCKPADITATATTRASGGAVWGVIRLRGKHCSLHLDDGPTMLLDSSGTALHLAPMTRHTNELVGDPRADIPLAAGDALWGFSWAGSWCGPRAASVVLPLVDRSSGTTKSYGTAKARLIGRQPGCSGSSAATLTQGYAGSDRSGDDFSSSASAVLPAPPAWGDLRASLALPATVSPTRIPVSPLTITNPTDRTITLLPCPTYTLEIGGWNSVQSGIDNSLPCTGSMVVPARGHLRVSLPAVAYGEGQPHQFRRGTRVTVRVAIANLSTVTASTVVG